jgi:integrase/recombinase XerD
MHDNNLIGPWIRQFLLQHLVAERNLARNTQISYRDTLVLLLPFMGRTLKTPVDRLDVEDMSPQVIRCFLEHLEKERNCSGATRNLRLGAIHSLAKFIGEHSPEHIAWCAAVRTIPFRKVSQPMMAYLDKPEMDAELARLRHLPLPVNRRSEFWDQKVAASITEVQGVRFAFLSC